MKNETLNMQVKSIIQGAYNKENYLNRYDTIRDFIYYTSKRLIVLIYELWRAFEFICKVIAMILTFIVKYFWSVLFVIVAFIAGSFSNIDKRLLNYFNSRQYNSCDMNKAGCGVVEFANELKKKYKID